ncbi:MAG TPA: GNAT family N-acetyltransferase [Rhodanobacteraceae bacterium]|jgi:GNAT superfamily N-acetyltransferase
MMLRFSPLDTARFGLCVHRATLDRVDVDALVAEIERERIDVAILRVPAPATGVLDELARRGLGPITADTLVRYEIDLPRPATDPQRADVTLRPAVQSDALLLDRMTRSIFAGYVSHYHANPLFPPDKILDGYAEWAVAHLGAEGGPAAWLVESGGETVGFSCYQIERPSGLAVGVLNGVVPSVRGRGVYTGMLSAMLAAFESMGLRRFAIATQAHNATVQRIWARCGLSLQGEYTTIHLNALRGRSAASDAIESGRPAAAEDRRGRTSV